MTKHFVLGRFVFALTGAVLAHGAAWGAVPLINESVYPASVPPGSPAFTLKVSGNGFTSKSTVDWNGSALPTHYTSEHLLTASVSASDVAKPRSVAITVSTPGAALSNPIYFQVVSPTRTINFTGTDYTVGNSPEAVVTADFNHDGNLDAAVMNYADGTISVMLGNGEGTFRVLPPYMPVAQSRLNSMALGDFDNDGNDDLVVLVSELNGNQEAVVLLGNGNGTFSAQKGADVRVDPHINAAQLVTGDFNGDGALDIAVSDQQGSHLLVLLGNRTGELSLPILTSLPSNQFNPVWMAVGDFNGDGKLDLAVEEPDAALLAIWLGDGSGHFTSLATMHLNGSGPGVVVAADFNGDQRPDLVIANGNQYQVFLGKGNGTFLELPATAIGGTSSVVVADFNGDGKLDLAMQNYEQTMVLLGEGNGKFQAPLTWPAPAGSGWVIAGDFDNDGQPDLLGLLVGGSSAAVYLQTP